MFCPYCGKQIDDGSKHCQYCGKAVTQDASSPAPAQAPAPAHTGPKFCQNCGAPAEGGKFCQSCGSPL